MMNIPKMVLFLCILLFQCGISMEENTIKADDVNVKKENDTEPVALNVQNDGLVLGSQNNNTFGTQQQFAQKILKVIKWAFFHPGAFLCSSGGVTYFIFKDQPELGVYSLVQILSFISRYTCPNFGLSKGLNNLAYFCQYPVPESYIPTPELLQQENNNPAQFVQSDVNNPTLNQPDNNVPLVQAGQNQQGGQNTQIVAKNQDNDRNCKLFCGWVLMSNWSFVLTAILLISFTYEDTWVIGLIITLQAMLYFIRKKCPQFGICRQLNQWAHDVNADWEPVRSRTTHIQAPSQGAQIPSIIIPMQNTAGIPLNLNFTMPNNK